MMIASSMGPLAFLALAFTDLVILVGLLVLRPRPYDDGFIYGTVNFLALALLIFFMGPLVSRPRPHDDSFILWDRQLLWP